MSSEKPSTRDEQPSQQDNASRRLAGAASLLSLGSVLSRILGLVRTQLISYFFGTTPAADAFVAAQRAPTMIYDQLIGGQISAAIVPVLSAYREKERAEMWRAASVLTSVIAAISGFAGIGLYLFAPQIARVLVVADNTPVELVAGCLRFMAPAVVLFGLSGMFTGILYARERFARPALAAPAYNVAMILGFFAFRNQFPTELQVYALPLGVSIGALFQALILGLGLRVRRSSQNSSQSNEGPIGLRPTLRWRHPVLKKVFLLYLPVALGLLVTQFQILAATRLASMAGEGVQSVLNFSDRLIQFPQGFVASAISVAILPRLAGAFGNQETQTFARTLARGLRMVVAIIVPAAIGMAILAGPMIGMLFQFKGGAFDDADRLMASLALYGYLIGLPFAAIDLSLNNAFYARKNTVLPGRRWRFLGPGLSGFRRGDGASSLHDRNLHSGARAGPGACRYLQTYLACHSHALFCARPYRPRILGGPSSNDDGCAACGRHHGCAGLRARPQAPGALTC